MTQTIQVAGSLCVLLPFMLVQFKKMRPTSVSYLTFNAVGSTVLAVLAALSSQWGFLLLESVWAIVSWHSLGKYALARISRRRFQSASPSPSPTASSCDAIPERGAR
ncbi:CBU_0592 family membrane protein [Mycolicibacterium pallens]|uniref:CBU-0592-like domain-containing protein n=1 Tax=Mycolicibacterium pallens TaxID=370524 RepID=A0ABX8VHM2_9MYCO|nr:hypothetical protein [Mycolicibacterium pallens]QYL15593.1 hypothetical protein K0O64_21195 [Mycolicibacterium pallens]